MMQIDFLKEAEKVGEELAAVREMIHRSPELGNQEHKTSQLVEHFLQSCGIETKRPMNDTAIVGVLRGGLPGKTVALRADMDALPIQETTGAAFASETSGVMHACGHDVHVAAALGAAKLLSEHREQLRGTVVFLFEPDEEGNGGAKRMIEAGCMQGVAAVFGAHVSPDLPLGTVGVRFGKFYAASDMFTVRVCGKSAHGAQPEKGIDALAAAAKMVTELRCLPSTLKPEPCVLSIGMLQAGTVGNIIADRAVFSGILRTLGKDSRAKLKQSFMETVQRVCAESGTKADIELRESYSGVVNTAGETSVVKDAAATLLGEENVVVLQEPLMTTEDFGYFVDASSGSFYHVGAGCEAPLHSPEFIPDSRVVPLMAALHAAIINTYLNQ